MYIVGLIIYFLIVFFSVASHGYIGGILDTTGFLFIVGSVLSIIISSGQLEDFLKLFKYVCKVKISEDDKAKFISLRGLSKKVILISIYSSILGFLLGIIILMMDMSDMTKVGHILKVSFTSLIYGLTMAFVVFLPINMKIEKYINER